jgi:hypothetical protein
LPRGRCRPASPAPAPGEDFFEDLDPRSEPSGVCGLILNGGDLLPEIGLDGDGTGEDGVGCLGPFFPERDALPDPLA